MTLIGESREKLFGISINETSVESRGFHVIDESGRERVEWIGRMFVNGYHAALREGPSAMLSEILDQTDIESRGFAYEGAAMGLAMLDYLTPWGRSRFRTFLQSSGADHPYMMHVGAGWAMARLPWRIEARLAVMDPLLGWFAIDGYGFHEGYFNWRKSINQQYVPRTLNGYARRVYRQGLGRSILFVKGGDVNLIAKTIKAFPVKQHPDLWSGVGLAVAYAGGVRRSQLERLLSLAQTFRPELAQGVAFASKARQRAGNPASHTNIASELICNLPADTAAQLTDDALLLPLRGADVPAFEIWRQRIIDKFR